MKLTRKPSNTGPYVGLCTCILSSFHNLASKSKSVRALTSARRLFCESEKHVGNLLFELQLLLLQDLSGIPLKTMQEARTGENSAMRDTALI